VPVKDCYQNEDDAKNIDSSKDEDSKSAASKGALRRSEQKIERCVAYRPRLKIRRFLRQCIRHLAIAEEAAVRRFGHAVAKFVAQLGAVQLALLAQFFQPLGIGCQGFHRLAWSRRLTARGQ
jgi:hypothetical protein